MTAPILLKTTTETLPNGKRLRFARLGNGPPMVLLHGYPENLQVWSQLAPLLAEQHEVFAFDWPGMGYSEAWPGGATPRIMANRLGTIIEQWRIEKPTIVGMDMGGQPALVFAAEHYDRIHRLVVMNSLVFGNEKTSWEIRLLRKFGFNRVALRHLARIIFHRAQRTFLPRGASLDEVVRQDFWAAFSKPETRRFISKMCAGYQGTLDQLPGMYEKIVCPTLILWAEQDKHFPLVQARKLHEAIPDSSLQVITKGTHWMVLNSAQQLADCIHQWERSLD